MVNRARGCIKGGCGWCRLLCRDVLAATFLAFFLINWKIFCDACQRDWLQETLWNVWGFDFCIDSSHTIEKYIFILKFWIKCYVWIPSSSAWLFNLHSYSLLEKSIKEKSDNQFMYWPWLIICNNICIYLKIYKSSSL